MKKKQPIDEHFFGTANIWKILFKVAPPVMLAQLILALYNIVDSFFVGKYSGDGLTALSVIYPVQLIVMALAIGTGVGVNTYMAKQYALNKPQEAQRTAGAGLAVALVMWAVFSVASIFVLKPYAESSASSPQAVKYTIDYGIIVCVGSLGLFCESIWTKAHQARGNMFTPTIAQIAGAVTNIILDPILIFGWWIFPAMGIKGAAIATVAGQFVAAVIVGVKGCSKPPKLKESGAYVKQIFKLGYPSILMQAMFTVYIGALNLILANRFNDQAVTVLGLYYKLQAFFFIPLFGLQTCIVPILSYNYTNKQYDRCKKIFADSLIISAVCMTLGILCFEIIPTQLISIFSKDQKVFEIGKTAFRIIGLSFLPAVFSMMSPIFFQAIGYSKTSTFLSVLRQLICLVPVFWGFSYVGLNYCWIAFPVAETVTTTIGVILYFSATKKWKAEQKATPPVAAKMPTE